MKKRILIKVELVSASKKDKPKGVGNQNVVAIPYRGSKEYLFYYFDNNLMEELIIKSIEMIGMEALILEPPKKRKRLLSEKDIETN